MNAGLSFAVPRRVMLAVAVFIAVQALAIGSLRGVDEGAGTLLNTAKTLSFNTYEDDGAINVFAALGYFKDHSNRFSYLINIGGPALHLARLAVSAGDALGLVKRFDDPLLYLSHPDELLRVWKFFGWFKLLVFTIWLPLAVYWLAANHFSRRAGTLACWAVCLMPFLTGFETRMKCDGAAIAFMLLSLTFQIDYLRRWSRKSIYWAAAFLGLSLSIKLLAASALATFFLIFFTVERRRSALVRPDGAEQASGPGALTRLAKACGIMAAVFILANPLFLAGLAGFIKALANSPLFFKGASASATPGGSSSLAAAILHRFTHFTSFYGVPLGWAVFPALAYSLVLLAKRRRLDANAVILAAVAADAAYTGFVAGPGLALLTYYYFSLAVLLLFPMAGMTDDALSFAASRGRVLSLAAMGSVAILGALLFREDAAVLAYLRQPPNRQLAHAWIEDNAGPGASIGVPLEPGAGLVNAQVRVDPFRHRLAFIGQDGRLLGKERPGYALMIRRDPAKPVPRPEGYLPAAVFDQGADLPHERFDMFQEEQYYVFKRTESGRAGEERGSGAMEKELGDILFADPEPSFSVMQYQALQLYPISLDLLRKTGGTILPLPAAGFFGALRHESSPLAFLHQADPAVLTLWGVKYVLARSDAQGGFAENVLASGDYPLREIARLAGDAGGSREAALYRNEAYAGQAYFLPDPAPSEVYRQEPSFNWKRPWRWLRASLPRAGTLYPAALRASAGATMARVRMEIEADGPMDVIVKGGVRARSALTGPGRQLIDLPYEMGEGSGDLEYEVNPAGHDGSCRILSLEVSPLRILGPEAVRNVTATAREGFALVDAPVPGRLAFALPYNAFWRARVDGEEVSPGKDVAGVASVPVKAGRRFVALRFE